MRVHALAKEYGIKSTEFVDIIQGFGIDVKSHLSGLDDGQVSDIRHKMKLKDESEETVIPEDEWEFTDSEEVDELLIPDVEEEKTDDWEMTETSGDTSAEKLSIGEVEKEIEKNVGIAERAREEYAKSVNEKRKELDGVEVDEQLNPVDEMKDGELKPTSYENREHLEPVQEVIVDRPRGFWGWLKSLFT